MGFDVIVINGGSSSGKSTLVRALQAALPSPWLSVSIDTFVDALPATMREGNTGIDFAPDGGVSVGADFRRLERAWTRGIAEMARAGAPIILDDVFLSGGESQARLLAQLEGLRVLWVGAHCSPDTAEAREATRPDRTPGMAVMQAELVHRGVRYDLDVDTGALTPEAAARLIVERVIAA
ncbi:chloramphenicol phosphotransferase [Mycetocola tolaasinivorans]|uniref:Chloramphenicol phosphotransferase n=1 Tax=Mycetocola tolaasinivorans TaxID=76635 RepID=A0A3L7A717_9MICO|nr:AAA family ATPase [Mycetocola tolaasinivorans]RLP75361.1 chloramphenicol phosphotransferase [Mycetocola tolaasinivorans]